MTRSRHPLALLRALTGDTQLSYALLVADTHEALGFGKLHRRREKVSRWETQGVPPDHSTQLAIAHIHRVPEEEVQRLGWPHWLHLGTAATPRADRARHGEEDAGAVPEKERPTVHPARCRLTVTGAALAAFVRETRTAVTVAPPAARGAHRVTSETLALIEDRSYALYELVSTVNPVTLYRLSRAELDLTCALLADSGHDRATGARLQLVTAHIAHLCGLISKGLGEDVRAERHYLAAVRAAARAASPLTVSLCLADLAWSHIDAGDPADVLSLVEAARAITPAPPPGLSAVLHSREARAYARRGEIIAGARALDRTVDALGTGGDPPRTATSTRSGWTWRRRGPGSTRASPSGPWSTSRGSSPAGPGRAAPRSRPCLSPGTCWPSPTRSWRSGNPRPPCAAPAGPWPCSTGCPRGSSASAGAGSSRTPACRRCRSSSASSPRRPPPDVRPSGVRPPDAWAV
ncbi:hypothetical protein ACFQ2B_04435 [Streptomyces stramineus]